MNLDPSLWLIRPKPNPSARLRLVCFPYAGGGVPTFRQWITAFPSDYELTIVQLPGRGSFLREKPFVEMDLLIPDLVRVLEPDLNRPYAFFGHSLGALIAYEIVRILQNRGIHQLIHLFVSGRGAPHVPDSNPPIYHLPDSQFIDKIYQFNGTPQEILANQELMQIFLPILRADFTLNETYKYRPGKLLTCPVTAFGGDRDGRVPYESLQAWKSLTTGRFHSIICPGDHFFLHSEQEQLTRVIIRELGE
jgi:medium-chain acyl-[acyl-carrier-protein] hydrolase